MAGFVKQKGYTAWIFCSVTKRYHLIKEIRYHGEFNRIRFSDPQRIYIVAATQTTAERGWKPRKNYLKFDI